MKQDLTISRDNSFAALPRLRSSVLGWLVVFCFGTGIVAGGQVAASKKSGEIQAAAQQQVDLQADTFFRTEKILRRKIYGLQEQVVALQALRHQNPGSVRRR